MTNHYELLYLVAGSYTEEELNPIKGTMGELISKYEGNITFEDNFGKKKLAYPVKKNTQGYYLIIEFDLDGEKLKDLSNEVKLTNEILRHVIVKRKPGSAHASLSMSEKIITDGPRQRTRTRASTSRPTSIQNKKVEDKKVTPTKTIVDNKEVSAKDESASGEKEETKKPVQTDDKQSGEESSEKSTDDSKVKLDNLDEKLDELLEGDIM